MTAPLSAILERLDALVACDTRNPPRAIDKSHPIVGAVRAGLPDFEVGVDDRGDGAVNILARRGAPKWIFNCHLDTVPANDAWRTDPFKLVRGDDRAVGLGACDIKGAAACMMAAAAATDAPAALLFTTDEEHGEGRCVRGFLESDQHFECAIVAEPTDARALMSHRGVGSYRLTFSGTPGHASRGDAYDASAVHRAARFVVEATNWARETELEGGPLPGVRLNVGRIEGGEKPNMIASSCEVRIGARPGPSRLVSDVGDALWRIARKHGGVERQTAFSGEALAYGARAREFAIAAKLPLLEEGDFWTEAALFAQAGIPSFVLGSGDIAQAHTAEEFVAYDSLERTFDAYVRLLTHEF